MLSKNKGKKKILLVAFPSSIHTARWISQINDQGWDIHLFPSLRGELIHRGLTQVTVHHLMYRESIASPQPSGKRSDYLHFADAIDAFRTRILDKKFPLHRARQLIRVINRLQPDIIHSMEMQSAGYLTLLAKKHFKGEFPPWIVTNWGSDIYLFGRLQQHKGKIRDVLTNCDYYSCECQRDVSLANQFGFNKTVLPVFPNTGGFDLVKLEKLRSETPTSKRRFIMLKGYQNWAGRGLVGLRALERCVDVLEGYTIVIYSAYPEVAIAAELLTEKTGIPTQILPYDTPHHEMLSLHARSRISIGLSISDAISTSLLEAMVMGSFPIQSRTACADEWVENNVSGIIVPPEDPDIIESAIRKALCNNDLVDRAARLNWQVALNRLDDKKLKKQVVNIYRALFNADSRRL